MANLITLEELKTAKKLSKLDDDPQLESLISSVSQLVKTYCANSFVDYYGTDKTETFNVTWDTNVLQVTESPLNTITSVEERTSYSSAYTALTEEAFEYYIDTDTDTVFRTNSTGFIYWPQGPGSVRVVYKAGYSTVPLDLKLAIIDMIWYYHKDEHKVHRSIGSTSISNKGTSSQRNNVGFPDHIKRVLDLHKQLQI
jgi:hypothetical protein